jgi:hypothetical protein
MLARSRIINVNMNQQHHKRGEWKCHTHQCHPVLPSAQSQLTSRRLTNPPLCSPWRLKFALAPLRRARPMGSLENRVANRRLSCRLRQSLVEDGGDERH